MVTILLLFRLAFLYYLTSLWLREAKLDDGQVAVFFKDMPLHALNFLLDDKDLLRRYCV